jgi:hypothetical protein
MLPHTKLSEFCYLKHFLARLTFHSSLVFRCVLLLNHHYRMKFLNRLNFFIISQSPGQNRFMARYINHDLITTHLSNHPSLPLGLHANNREVNFMLHMMINHLILFLACFWVIFGRFYQQNIGVLDQLPMTLGHLYCFLFLSMQFYSSRYIAILGCSWCNSQRIKQIRQSKTSEDLCGPWEDEEWIFKRPQKTLQREELCSQVPRHLTLKNTPKQAKKTGILAQKTHWSAQAHQRRRSAPRHYCTEAPDACQGTISSLKLVSLVLFTP